MIRRMIATITKIESVVTPTGKSGHVVVPKAWIGKEAIVTLKDKETEGEVKTSNMLANIYQDFAALANFLRLVGFKVVGANRAKMKEQTI